MSLHDVIGTRPDLYGNGCCFRWNPGIIVPALWPAIHPAECAMSSQASKTPKHNNENQEVIKSESMRIITQSGESKYVYVTV